jgi:putative SOS response-associated peptidase YedK
VILQPDTAKVWMSGSKDALEAVTGQTPALRAWPVDRRVNNARNQGADLIDVAGAVIR